MADEKHTIAQLLDHPLTWLFGTGGAGTLLGGWFERRKRRAEAKQVDAMAETTLSGATLAVVTELRSQIDAQNKRLERLEEENQNLYRQVVELRVDNAALRAHIAQLTRRAGDPPLPPPVESPSR